MLGAMATRMCIEQVAADGLRDLRIAANLTQQDLAGLAGLSLNTVSRIESGRVQPTRGTLRLLAIALAEARES
jgi:transcriptional regulator with XRE-family HTH domain